jgi:hypothetical protein
MSHMRIVIAHMLGSSILDTEALTSGKGLFSSIAARLNSILRGGKMVTVGQRRGRHERKEGNGGQVRVTILVNLTRSSSPSPYEKAKEKRTGKHPTLT